MRRSPNRCTTPKRDKISPKNRSLSVHIVEWSTAVVKVAVKIINASLTQRQCLQLVTPPSTLRYRDCATPLNWTMTAWWSWATSTTKQNQIYQFFQRFNQWRLQFLFTYFSAIDLQCRVLSFWKAFVKCPSLSVNGIFDDVRYDVIST